MTAVVALSTGLELGIATALFLAFMFGLMIWDYRRIGKRYEAARVQTELEELEQDWGWPEKWSPTEGESHLGHPHVGERRR